MAEKSTKPYLIRAIHEWCSDSGLTPYISVQVNADTRVPAEHVKNGEIVLNVGMPHVLWQLQGEQVLRTETQSIPRGSKGEVEKREVQKLVLENPGAMSPADYDRMVGDLVNFLAYVAEPSRQARIDLGIYVLLFLGVLFVLAYLLKKECWKDVHRA